MPENGAVRGVVQYHHGLGGYALSEEEMFLFLARHGVAVLAFDAHGHGRSEPTARDGAATIASFEHIVDDHVAFISSVLMPFCAANCPAAPVFLMGSSMGAASTILALARPEVQTIPQLRGAVIIAAAIDAQRTLVMRLQEPFAALANRIVPNLALVPKRHPRFFNRDELQWTRRLEDKLLQIGPIKVCTACSMLQAFALIRAHSAAISTPLLALHGALDEVCPIGPVQSLLAGGTAATDTTLKVFPEGVHDLIHDPEKTELMECIVAWLQQHGLPAA